MFLHVRLVVKHSNQLLLVILIYRNNVMISKCDILNLYVLCVFPFYKEITLVHGIMLGGTAVSRTLSRAMLALAEGCGCARQNLTPGIMSVFRGCVTEYPGIIVDHFIPSNCQRGRAFFLSHCHKGTFKIFSFSW